MESDLLAKLRWSCRRGMKELDLLLIPFAENELSNLSESQLQVFKSLLQLDDLALFDSFFKHKILADQTMQTMVETIRYYQQNTLQCGKLN